MHKYARNNNGNCLITRISCLKKKKKKKDPPCKRIIPHVANLQSSIPVVHHWSCPLCYIVAPDCIGETSADPRAHEIPASMEQWDEQEQGYWRRCPHRWCFLEHFAEAEMSTECPFINKKLLPFNRALNLNHLTSSFLSSGSCVAKRFFISIRKGKWHVIAKLSPVIFFSFYDDDSLLGLF